MIAMCWKCRDVITKPVEVMEGFETGAREMVGCDANAKITDFETAQQFCPLTHPNDVVELES